MQKILLAAGVAALLGLGGAASAADLYSGGSMKDAPAPYTPVTSWPGFYFGGNGGYGWGNGGTLSTKLLVEREGDDPATKISPEGGFAGGQIGYNWQRDNIVYGLEFDMQGSWIKGSGQVAVPFGDDAASGAASAGLDYFGTLRARAGVTVLSGGGLLYATGGFAFGGVRDKLISTVSSEGGEALPVSASKSTVATGFTVGGGFEYLFDPRWSIKVEYQYIDLGSDTLKAQTPFVEEGIASSSSAKFDHTYNTVRAGLNYHIPPAYESLK